MLGLIITNFDQKKEQMELSTDIMTGNLKDPLYKAKSKPKTSSTF